ncbi:MULTISPECIES: resolvase [Streptomyces]|nr:MULTISPECIES: resolvase [Streptomyces]
MVQTLAAARRAAVRPPARAHLRRAEGRRGQRQQGRPPPAVTAEKADAVRTAYLDGQSIAALAREHGVSRGAIRTAVADLMPEHTTGPEDVPAPELPVLLDMPGKVADFLREADLPDDQRSALAGGVTVRRGQGYTLRVNAAPSIHRELLARSQPLDGAQAVPAQRKARREYENRVNALIAVGERS